MAGKLKVIDFFCGAGGFSEGFRLQGFKVIMGVDNWKPAVETHNVNHGLNDNVIDILDFESSIENIEILPDSEIIIGSPPCVSFSMSNNAGKADKSLGIRLIESYLRVVAVKKHKKNSILKAWLMENVPNSRNFVKEAYSFSDLGLTSWAKENGYKARAIALRVRNNGDILTASDYGSPQKRDRFVCGEIIRSGKFPLPDNTHEDEQVVLKDIIGKMPRPNSKVTKRKITDPNYPGLEIPMNELTDHFYDTGVYEVEWRESKFSKMNHPFMGKMCFPENTDKPSRTIMATRSASTREALIYRSETGRKGDGEYRLPTIREISTLMGFPYTYQFIGSEGTKWRLIGNAVCPHMSYALGKAIKEELNLRPMLESRISFEAQKMDFAKTNDLSDGFKLKSFDSPPKKKRGSKLRRHPIKAGNMTINLTNYDPKVNKSSLNGKGKWYGFVFIGSGKTYKIEPITPKVTSKAESLLKKAGLKSYLTEFENFFSPRMQSAKSLQDSYERNLARDELNPINMMDEIRYLVINQKNHDDIVSSEGLITKDNIPLSQVMSIYSIGKIVEATKK